MSRKYIRQVRATFSGSSGGSLVVEDLRIEFDVEKTISSIPNAGEVRVYNLNSKHRYAVGKELDHVVLEAGYVEGGMGIILTGDISDVFHERSDVDIISKVTVGDGDKADRQGYVAKTYPAGTEIKDIVKDIQKGMPGVSLGELKGLDEIPPTRRPVTLVSSSRRALDTLGRSNDFYWSVQNETLETIPFDGFLNQRTLITPQTGMIGVPTITDNGIIVKALLDPSIRPNRLIEVHSETLDMNGEKSGTYRVSGVAFGGDNMDGDFYVEAEGQLVQGGKVVG
ncbi:MAG TPA: hypothetical protein VIL30_04425 [Ramlibacter sp.]|jgi:hypothetical protein